MKSWSLDFGLHLIGYDFHYYHNFASQKIACVLCRPNINREILNFSNTSAVSCRGVPLFLSLLQSAGPFVQLRGPPDYQRNSPSCKSYYQIC